MAAARALLAEGVDPTVEAVADRAGISRTTAYRYFPNRRALLAASYPETGVTSLLPADAPADPSERLDTVMASIAAQLREHEPELRAQLRLSLEPGPPGELPLRQGRALRWIEDALAPLAEHMGEARLRRLALSIRATLGIESLVWLTDVGGVSRDEAVAIMSESARTLFRAAVAESVASGHP